MEINEYINLTERQQDIIHAALDIEYVRLMLKSVMVSNDTDKYEEVILDMKEIRTIMDMFD